MDTDTRNFEASNTTVFFNTRDEMVKVKLDKVAYFEADSNYSHVVFVNGAKATLLTSSKNIIYLNNNPIKRGDILVLKFGDVLTLGMTDIVIESNSDEATRLMD